MLSASHDGRESRFVERGIAVGDTQPCWLRLLGSTGGNGYGLARARVPVGGRLVKSVRCVFEGAMMLRALTATIAAIGAWRLIGEQF